VSDTELTTLIAKPRTWQRVQRWPSVLLLAIGIWATLFSREPAGLVFVALGYWGTAEFWRGVHVTGDRMVAQGRVRRITVPLADFLQVGLSPSRTVWVQSRGRRTVMLNMAERRVDAEGSLVDIHDRLRELAEAAGATLDPPLDGLHRAPRPATVFFGW